MHEATPFPAPRLTLTIREALRATGLGKPRAPSSGTTEVKSPPGINYIDQMCEAQDRIDRAAAARVRVETELMEAMMKDKTLRRAKSDYNPFSRERMGFSDDD
jgi:hypothetical protein